MEYFSTQRTLPKWKPTEYVKNSVTLPEDYLEDLTCQLEKSYDQDISPQAVITVKEEVALALVREEEEETSSKGGELIREVNASLEAELNAVFTVPEEETPNRGKLSEATRWKPGILEQILSEISQFFERNNTFFYQVLGEKLTDDIYKYIEELKATPNQESLKNLIGSLHGVNRNLTAQYVTLNNRHADQDEIRQNISIRTGISAFIGRTNTLQIEVTRRETTEKNTQSTQGSPVREKLSERTSFLNTLLSTVKEAISWWELSKEEIQNYMDMFTWMAEMWPDREVDIRGVVHELEILL